jgi:hypothetical protein
MIYLIQQYSKIPLSHIKRKSALIFVRGKALFRRRDWMKRLSATPRSGILLRKSCGIDRGKKESQLWTSAAVAAAA